MKRTILYPALAIGLIGSLHLRDFVEARKTSSTRQAYSTYSLPAERPIIVSDVSLEAKVKDVPVANAISNTPYHSLIQKASQKYNIPFEILDSLVFQESSYNPDAVSNCGAQGLAQLMPGTAKLLKVANPFNPEENIDAGAKYLSRMFRMFGQSPKPIEEQWKFALAAYNAGPGNVIDAQKAAKSNGLNPNLWESIDDFMPKEETRDYVKKISEKSHLNSLYSKN